MGWWRKVDRLRYVSLSSGSARKKGCNSADQQTLSIHHSQDFRFKVSEIIKDVIFIVSSISCFKQMFLILQSANVSWESSEAALFIMQNVARNILP